MKAKDLLKNQPDESTEQDKVTSAYENITKRLAKLRGEGEDAEIDEDEFDDDELKDTDMDQKGKLEEEKPGKIDELDPLDNEGELNGDEIEKQNKKDEEQLQKDGEEDGFIAQADESGGEDEDLIPRKTFVNPRQDDLPEERQFRTTNVNLAEEKGLGGMDELAEEGGRAEGSEDLEIPAVAGPQKPKYSFYERQNQAEGDYLRRGPNVSPFGSEFQRRGSRGAEERSSIFQLIILLLIGAAVIGGTVYFLKNQSFSFGLPFLGTSQLTPQPSVEVVVIPTPIPTPMPVSIDRSKFKLRVLNGTGKTGLAASVSAKLKDLGYKIERTGNATNSAFQKSLVRVKENQSTLSGQLVQDLLPDFAADVSVSLKPGDLSDGEVILGLQ